MNADLRRLKAQMLVEGVNVDDAAEKLFRAQNPSGTKRGGLSSGGRMDLGRGVLVNAPFYAEREVELTVVAEPERERGVRIQRDDEVLCNGTALPAPAWYNNTVSWQGETFPITRILTAHNRQLVGSVYEDCALFARGTQCTFCVMNRSLGDKPRVLVRKEPGLLLATLERIDTKEYAGITLNGGMTLRDGRGIELMIPAVEAIWQTFPRLPIGIEITPPKNLDWIDRLVESGCRSLMMNLEMWDPAVRHQFIPGKNTACPRDSYFTAFERALLLLGKGKVSTCFVVGVEPIESLKKGIRAVVDAGVIPSPLAGRTFEDVPGYPFEPKATVDEFLEILDFAEAEIARADIRSTDSAGCVACGMCDMVKAKSLIDRGIRGY